MRGRAGIQPFSDAVIVLMFCVLAACAPGTASYNLALELEEKGQFAEAEEAAKRAVELDEKAYGSDHEEVATDLMLLGDIHVDQGRYSEAGSAYVRGLAILEKVLGAEHPSVARSLVDFAGILEVQGRYDEAELLYRRSLAIHEKVLGTEHPDVAISLNGLASLLILQNRHEEAEPLYRRSLAIREKALGAEDPIVSLALNNLASLYLEQARYADAIPLFRRSLAILEKARGAEHPNVATILNNLALALSDLGRKVEAEPLYRRSLAIKEKILGPENPDVADSLNNLSHFHADVGQQDLALEEARRATVIYRKRLADRFDPRSSNTAPEVTFERIVFLHHVTLLTELNSGARTDSEALRREAFEVGQLLSTTSVGQAISRMAARFADGQGELARLVRKQQDLTLDWWELDKALIAALSRDPDQRSASNEDAMRQQMTRTGAELDALGIRLNTDFPEYADLTNPEPMRPDEVEALLAEDEAVLTYILGPDHSYLWVLRQGNFSQFVLEPGEKVIAETVASLRNTLDPKLNHNLLEPFPVQRAYELFQQILQPAMPKLAGVRTLYIVPQGPLLSLPFSVLVTAEPPPVADPSDYQKVPWLARQFATSTLPSVSSLRALRAFAKRSDANELFIGFGDPKLQGEPIEQPSLRTDDLFRGALANVDRVRRMSPLPDSARELRLIADGLGAGPGSIHISDQASERIVKATELQNYKVVAFATHGLIAGDLGLGEPALVLTPPELASEVDDGLLTASEVANLKLDADWVILSACNTAAPDGTPGAEGLSGLARSFFYAGSRSLLVSHWLVETRAAVALTTGTIAVLKAAPEIGRAEALRRARMDLLDHPPSTIFAHPAIWAPFEIIGEGR
jgi:CHAT domain-containing protein